MENLNAESVKKALECLWYEKECVGDECPLFKLGGDCAPLIAMNALALINSQEQRIKELAEERDGFENLAHTAIETQNRMSDTIEELTEENERLEAYIHRCKSGEEYWVKCLIDRADETKADTVREFAERLKERNKIYCVNESDLKEVDFVIDQIAKEMLEGENEN